MLPSLFKVDGFERSGASAPAVRTPLGVVQLRCAVGGEDLTSLASEVAAGATGDGQLMLWDSAAFRAELLMRPVPNWSPSREIDSGCILATWRLLAHRPAPPVALSIGWSSDALWVSGGPDGGECLDALTYWDAEVVGAGIGRETVEVSFGTVSGDCITRGLTGWWPDRWTWEVLGCDHPYCEGLVEYGSDCLVVPLPAFAEGERCTVRFSVAWGSPTAVLTPALRADAALWSTFRAENA